MADYLINGKAITLDTSKTYLDFYWQQQPDGQVSGQLIQLGLEKRLQCMRDGSLAVDANLEELFRTYQKWEVDAPRKRLLRDLRRSGVAVLTSDVLFEEDGGDTIIDYLENTGKFASYFLKEVFGKK